MRYLLLLLLYPTLAFGSCDYKLSEHFKAFGAEAAERYPALPFLRMEIAPLEDKLGGKTYLEKNLVVLSPRLCQFDELTMDSIISHEIGHAIAHMLFPKLAPGVEHEALADHYASQLWKKQDDLLAKLSSECLAGDKWYCEKQERWLNGMKEN